MHYILILLCFVLGILSLRYKSQWKKIQKEVKEKRQNRLPILAISTLSSNNYFHYFQVFKLKNLFIPDAKFCKYITELSKWENYYEMLGNKIIAKKVTALLKSFFSVLQNYCNAIATSLTINDKSIFNQTDLILNLDITLQCTSPPPPLGRFGGSILLVDLKDQSLQKGIDFECQFLPGNSIFLRDKIVLDEIGVFLNDVTDAIGNLRPEILNTRFENGFCYKLKFIDKIHFTKTIMLENKRADIQEEYQKIMQVLGAYQQPTNNQERSEALPSGDEIVFEAGEEIVFEDEEDEEDLYYTDIFQEEEEEDI